jgi:hypothetical protein
MFGDFGAKHTPVIYFLRLHLKVFTPLRKASSLLLDAKLSNLIEKKRLVRRPRPIGMTASETTGLLHMLRPLALMGLVEQILGLGGVHCGCVCNRGSTGGLHRAKASVESRFYPWYYDEFHYLIFYYPGDIFLSFCKGSFKPPLARFAIFYYIYTAPTCTRDMLSFA